MDEQSMNPEPDQSAPETSAGDSPQDSASATASDNGDQPRRNFLSEALAVVIGSIVGLVPLVTGTLFFLGPLFKKKGDGATVEGSVEKDADGRVKVANLSSLPKGRPEKFTVYDDKEDAWNMFLRQQVGAVYLRKIDDKKVQCLNVICPHLGCAVDYRSGENDYYCPCHLSSFAMDGSKQNDIPPRDLDELDIKVDDKGDVWVKFQDYKAGEATRIPVG